MANWAITTSKTRGKHGIGLTEEALQLAKELQIPILERRNMGLPKLLTEHQLEGLLVEEKGELIAYWTDGTSLSFHPGMAVPRIKQMQNGRTDILISAAKIHPGDQILDCTMGMANDAIVMAFAAGETGRVVALESSPLIYAVTRYGLQGLSSNSCNLKYVMERIFPMHCDYTKYLSCQQENSYDIIYLDPMFEKPVMASSGISVLRREANYMPLHQETLDLACKISRRCVVVKHRAGTLRALRFDAVVGGKYSSVAYGILYVGR